jgi:hypothetical protein
MKRLLIPAAIIILATAGLVACTRPNQAKETLEAQGFSNVEITGYAMWGCSSGKDDDENFHTKFTATGPTGKHVHGVVCSGLLKGATVRITGVE